MNTADTTTVYSSVTGLLHSHPRCGTSRYRTSKVELPTADLARYKHCAKCFAAEKAAR